MKLLSLFLTLVFLCLGVSDPLAALDRNDYFQQWQDLSQSSQFGKAVTVFEQAVLDYPNEAWFEVFLAHAYRMLDKPENALPHYEKALQLDAKTKGILDNVYAGYMAYGWFMGASCNDWDSAVQWLAKAASLSPDNPEAYNLQGIALQNAGKTEQALTAFETAFAKDPSHVNGPLKDNFRVGMEVGIERAKRLDDVSILDRYGELALKAYPNDEAVALEIFSALLSRKQVDRATKIYESAKAGGQKLLMRGRLQLSFGNEEEAYQIFDQLSRAPESDETIDIQIASAYRDLVENLDYEHQMASDYQTKVVEFSTRAVQKYFREHPYQQPFAIQPPLRGDFSLGQGAGGRSYHYGLEGHYAFDMVQAFGSPVFAVADGEVVEVEDQNPDRAEGVPVDLNAQANFVKLRHSGGIQSLYVHIKQGSVRVKVGQKVTAGTILAQLGNSGVTTGPHLHFQMMNEKDITVPPSFSGLTGRKSRTEEPFVEQASLETGMDYYAAP